MDVGISFSNPTSAGLQGFKQETSFKGEQSVSLSFFLVLVCLCLRYIYVKASTASHQSSGQLWVQVLAQGHFKRGGWERAKCHLPHPHFPIWSWYSSLFFSFLNLQASATWLSNRVSWVFSNMRILTRIKFTLRYWILKKN